jgi:hypothetical protein
MPGNPLFLLNDGNQRLKIRPKNPESGLACENETAVSHHWDFGGGPSVPHNRDPMRLEMNHRE